MNKLKQLLKKIKVLQSLQTIPATNCRHVHGDRLIVFVSCSKIGPQLLSTKDIYSVLLYIIFSNFTELFSFFFLWLSEDMFLCQEKPIFTTVGLSLTPGFG